jgi:hypothetical protein
VLLLLVCVNLHVICRTARKTMCQHTSRRATCNINPMTILQAADGPWHADNSLLAASLKTGSHCVAQRGMLQSNTAFQVVLHDAMAPTCTLGICGFGVCCSMSRSNFAWGRGSRGLKVC